MSEVPPTLSGGAPWATPNDVNSVRQFALSNSAASGSPGILRQTFGGGTIHKRIEQIKRRGGGGGFPRVLESGITVATGPGTEPTTAEYIEALQNCYISNDTDPAVNDLISLRYTGGSRLIARFWLLKDDQAATNATILFEYPPDGPPEDRVDYYALNMSYVPVEQIVDAMQDYAAGPNGGQQPDARDIQPAGEGAFAISVNGLYDTDPTSGFLVPAVGDATAVVLGGDIKISDDFTASIPALTAFSLVWPTVDGNKKHTRIYAKAVVNVAATSGVATSVDGTNSKMFYLTDSAVSGPNVPTNWVYNAARTKASRTWPVGVISLAVSGNRRYANITQTLVGNVDAEADGTGPSTPNATTGVVEAAGLRTFYIVANGYLYKTGIITGKMDQVT